MYYNNDKNNELYHYGVKGMKWGVRKYQDSSGRYTAEGRKRYVADKTKNYRRDIDSWRKYNVNGAGNRNKNGKFIYTKADIADEILGTKRAKTKAENRYGSKYDRAMNKQTKKYALKGYSQDAYNMNNGKLGRAYDKLTDAHKYSGRILYGISSEKARKERADKYITDMAKARSKAKRVISQ
jgi:hypothetical protein